MVLPRLFGPGFRACCFKEAKTRPALLCFIFGLNILLQNVVHEDRPIDVRDMMVCFAGERQSLCTVHLLSAPLTAISVSWGLVSASIASAHVHTVAMYCAMLLFSSCRPLLRTRTAFCSFPTMGKSLCHCVIVQFGLHATPAAFAQGTCFTTVPFLFETEKRRSL